MAPMQGLGRSNRHDDDEGTSGFCDGAAHGRRHRRGGGGGGEPGKDGKRPYDTANVRIANAHSHYQFTDSEPVEVLRKEWVFFLSLQRVGEEPVFELLPTAASAAVAPAPINQQQYADTYAEENRNWPWLPTSNRRLNSSAR